MAREAKQEYRYHEEGAIALYRRPDSAMWYARCKLDDGVALNPFSTGTDDEREAVKIAKKPMLYAEVDRERGNGHVAGGAQHGHQPRDDPPPLRPRQATLRPAPARHSIMIDRNNLRW
jgi:hypothetical protein